MYHSTNDTPYSRWPNLVAGKQLKSSKGLERPTIGLLSGEGIGPELTAAAEMVLKALSETLGTQFDIRHGGIIGDAATNASGSPLTDDVRRFCEDVFQQGGAVLAGPGGGRFVYDCRRSFNLFCKLNPLVTDKVLRNCGVIKPDHLNQVDIMVVRENLGGVYQGHWSESRSASGDRQASHSFHYEQDRVSRIANVAARFAAKRRGMLTLVIKPNGVPSISQLWLDCTTKVAEQNNLSLRVLEVDFAGYHLIDAPQEHDVILTSNLFGDLLADLGGILLGSRGLCYGASFSETGSAIYQTNHGAAHDLANTDRANPIAHLRALAMLLQESLGLQQEAIRLWQAMIQTLENRFRTFDIMEPDCKLVSTREMVRCISAAICENSQTARSSSSTFA